jgi:hypothetical protein
MCADRSRLDGGCHVDQSVVVLKWVARVGLVAIAMLAVGCRGGHNPAKSTTASVPSTTAASRFGPFGPRTFEVRDLSLHAGEWLTIGLHPDPTPVRVQVTPPQPMRVCPATLDGAIGPPASSWPSWFHFDACVSLDTSGRASLPATDGNPHVAFALRALTTRPRSRMTVAVSYSAEDSFVLIVPAAGTARTYVSFTPQSATAGAHPYLMPGFDVAPGARIAMSQHGRAVRRDSHCDFGSEIECFGAVTPNSPVSVILAGNGTSTTRFATYLSWA